MNHRVPTWRTAYVGLGSNLGDRQATLTAAVERLAGWPGLKVRRVSRFIETAPVGGPPQGPYLNAVAEVSTSLPPRALLEVLQQVEQQFGRTRNVRWGPRTLDLDLLLYGQEVVEEPDLQVPHPRMHLRRFVLEPLCEIAPQVRHPLLGLTAAQMLQRLDEREGEPG